ncbi:MAG: ribonuclease HII [Thermoplasmata archaeon]
MAARVGAAGDETAVGIDEAGRGAWLGPLVVAAVAVPLRRISEVPGTGARDSKELSPTARAAAYVRIAQLGTCRSVALRPRTIDRSVARGELNLLEARAFARLLRELSPHTAYLDACDANAERFGRTVAALAGSPARIISRHKADRDFPLVGAASIVAKVRRDRAIAALARRLGEEIGSGYPSDSRTVEYVRRTVPPGGPFPDWMRAEWATTKRVIPARPGPTLDGFLG